MQKRFAAFPRILNRPSFTFSFLSLTLYCKFIVSSLYQLGEGGDFKQTPL
jgi:hypothetical protein